MAKEIIAFTGYTVYVHFFALQNDDSTVWLHLIISTVWACQGHMEGGGPAEAHLHEGL